MVLVLMLAGMLTPALASAQEVASVEQQFAAYHTQLSGTAEELLSAAKMPEAQAEVTPIPAAADEAFLPALARVRQLGPVLEPILREAGVSREMLAVVLVESGGRSTALSPKGARGLWQLMPETARRYGLRVSAGNDERTNAEKSTWAAARYLRDLHAQFGDWKLAFAAYNAGERAVQHAIESAGSNDFSRVKALLPAETRAYVPAVTAAVPLFGNSTHFSQPMLRAAREARVIYASTQLGN